MTVDPPRFPGDPAGADLFDVPIEELRRRRSAKWTTYGPDVLPMPVAEMDVRLAPAISRELRDAVDSSDTGFAGDPTRPFAGFQGFAERRWGWRTRDHAFRTCADVATGATELLRLLACDRPVVVTPPVYPPFYAWIDAAGARAVDVPLRGSAEAAVLDLARIEQAFRDRARVLLLCHPHNPTGRLVPVDELRHLAELSTTYGATVISDEIHAPLTHPGHAFTPYLSVSEQAAATGIALHSASKAWNLAGLKCALIVTADSATMPDGLPHELPWGVGHLGLRASTVAYRDGAEWVDAVVSALHRNAALLESLLREAMPAVGFRAPQAGYLAWLDVRRLDLHRRPFEHFLEHARVALGDGEPFGPGGQGHVRMNFACSQEVLADAVGRLASSLPAARSGVSGP
jgi:cystathionine beta-lyase